LPNERLRRRRVTPGNILDCLGQRTIPRFARGHVGDEGGGSSRIRAHPTRERFDYCARSGSRVRDRLRPIHRGLWIALSPTLSSGPDRLVPPGAGLQGERCRGRGRRRLNGPLAENLPIGIVISGTGRERSDKPECRRRIDSSERTGERLDRRVLLQAGLQRIHPGDRGGRFPGSPRLERTRCSRISGTAIGQRICELNGRFRVSLCPAACNQREQFAALPGRQSPGKIHRAGHFPWTQPADDFVKVVRSPTAIVFAERTGQRAFVQLLGARHLRLISHLILC
jgi:hypothetical protein